MNNIPTQPPHSRQVFLDWYRVSSFGQVLQSLEASYLQTALKLTYNHKTLQVGWTGSETQYIDADFLRDFAVMDSPPLGRAELPARIAAGAADWPIASESIDTLILPHVLEFVGHRHQVLQEAERVLRPEGKLIILCLNPLSMHGIIQYLPLPSSYWRADFVTRHRLLDWLSLLKFDAECAAAFSITSARTFVKPDNVWDRARAELSFAFAVRAIKRRYNLLSLDATSWVPVPTLAAGSMFERGACEGSGLEAEA